MVFSDKDKILTKNLYQMKGYKVTELIKKISKQTVDKSSINKPLKKLTDTGTVNKLTDSGRALSAALNKMFIQLMIWFPVKKICCRFTE